MMERIAKPDFAHLHIALARHALGQPVEIPELDGPVPLFDDEDQALDDAVDRHPSNGGDAA